MKKRILFVDDEPNILQGLQRMLRCQRGEWDMAFAESGKQALELMEQDPFDAIVSDMRMPGMDGAELLAAIKDHWPESVRFILSGHSDQELVMRSVGPSHQYLSKPCDPERLKSKLTDAFALRELLASDSLRTLVAGMTSLPSLPTIYHAVVKALQSEDASIRSIGDLIGQDPGMTAKVLQLVNSAYFGLGRHIASPAEAASFLGLDILKNLVLSEGVFSQFDEAVVKAMSLDAIRSRSLLVSTVARQIARAEGADQKVIDQAFLGGLLLDMGTLVLAANRPDDFLRVRELMKQAQIDVWEAEQQVFGTTHAEVGAYMLGLWGIDDDVVAAVAYHHKPGHFPSTQFTAVTAVYVANTGLPEGMSKEPPPLAECLDLGYLTTLGLTERLPDWQALCIPLEEDAA
jgi:HD-like signal output (HDOD) protein